MHAARTCLLQHQGHSTYEELPQHLREEATFADEHYRPYADKLDMNETLFRCYANPRHMWDWRQRAGHYLGDLRGKRVLDYGCGQGEEAIYMAKMGAYVTAIDISAAGIDITKKRAAHNGVADRVTAVVMRCDPTTFPDASFDLVHGMGIIHHVGVKQSFDEINRLLKPGGVGVFLEHMGNSKLLETLRHARAGDYTDHERPVRWCELLELSGDFAEVKLHPYHLSCRDRRLRKTNLFRRLDHAVLSNVPVMRHFASGVVIYVRKRSDWVVRTYLIARHTQQT